MDHEIRLETLCRLCGIKIPVLLKSTSNHKDKYKTAIYALYNIDIDKDISNVHPPCICKPCRLRLSRYEKREDTQFGVNLPNLFNFVPHCDNCEVCQTKYGRPKKSNKRKLTIPAPSSVITKEHSYTSCHDASTTVNSQNISEDTDQDHEDNDSILQTSLTSPSPTVREHSKDKDSKDKETIPSTSFSSPPPDIGKLTFFDNANDANETSLSNHEFRNVVIRSIPIDRFSDGSLAQNFVCTICRGVPCEPMITKCGHIFCMECISGWFSISSACPVCRCILDDAELSPLHGQLLEIFDTLLVKCIHECCSTGVTIRNIDQHENLCPFACKMKIYDVTTSAKVYKLPLQSVSAKHTRHKRLKSVISSVNEFCYKENESKTDVLFFMLKDHLRENSDPRWKQIEKLWLGENPTLSAEQCLAITVDLLQSKGQYKSQYDFLKQNNVSVFRSPHQLDLCEPKFLPSASVYKIINDDGNILLQNFNNGTEPINVNQSFMSGFFELPTPNCIGVRWSYHEALALTLQELESDINKGLKEHNLDPSYVVFHTTVKDGCDGMGEVSVYREKDFKTLPDKAFRFSFCITNIKAKFEGNMYNIFAENAPNSVRTNRPLLESISDENNYASNVVCMLPIEKERDFIMKNYLHVFTTNGWHVHKISFFNSMVDEKRDRADGGLQSSGSKYLCTLCDADRSSAKSLLGSFDINRSVFQTTKIANVLRVNPDCLSENELKKISKGVKSLPLSTMEPIQKGIDATHADINLGQFFKKIIIREIAGVTKWDMTADVKTIIQKAETQFDEYMKCKCGINPQLMMPGNYARTLFETPHSILLHLLTNVNRKTQLSNVFSIFCQLRKVYRSNDPRSECPNEVKNYKKHAVEMGSILLEHFDYAEWPNYLHKIIEHVQQLIEDPNGPGSIGAFSSEGNESGNKLFRHFRKNLSRRGNTYGSLCDVLKLHWLYSSKTLFKLAEVEHKKNKCSLCFDCGHNKRTCPLLHVSL